MELTELNDFLQKQPEMFDFRDLMPKYYGSYKKRHQKNTIYVKLLEELEEMNTQDSFKKWFLYRTLGVGSAYKGCGKPFDCDNSNETCQLTAEIYKALWNKEVLSFCGKEDCPVGETMNSVSTTLGKLTGNKGMKQWKKLYKSDPECFQRISNKHPEVKEFIAVCHTIGNFTVWPAGCNGPRGIGSVKDYWDLTLQYIYQWYYNNKDLPRPKNDALRNLFGSQMVNFSNWLVAFGSWDEFVRANYMQDFVYAPDNKSAALDNGPFGEPRPLWNGHFSGNVLPEGEQIEEFFKNATECIKARSERMVKALRDK